MAEQNPLVQFVTTVRAVYSGTSNMNSTAAAILAPAIALLSNVTQPNRRPQRQVKPACGLLSYAGVVASQGPLGPIASSFLALEPTLHWTQNPNYNDEKMGAGYMEGYAYANVIGPDGLVDLPGLLVGVLILGPNRTYPPHAHPAGEVYHVLSGHAEWQSGTEPWEKRRPGAFIPHPPMMPHATRTGAETLMALYCWTGETATFADLLPKTAS